MKAFRGYFHHTSEQASRPLRLMLDNSTVGILPVVISVGGNSTVYGLDGVQRPDSRRRGVVIVKEDNGNIKKVVR